MAIPIKNVYYMLCYAWQEFEYDGVVDVESVDGNEMVDLFARILIDGVNHLVRRGLDRGYRTESQQISGVRGQIEFGRSINEMLFPQGKARCRVDELTHDVLHNRLVKSTMQHVRSARGLDGGLRAELGGALRYFRQVRDLPRLTPRLFGRVELHRNNRFYRFLLDICELIVRNLLITEDTGEVRFREFLRDEVQMSRIFEKFVRNFYAREHQQFRSKSHRLYWEADGDPADVKMLPSMLTDITLTQKDRVVVIDTKYYQRTLQSGRWDGNSGVYSSHLYQLYAYLNAYRRRESDRCHIEGMLLYPTIDRELRLDYEIDNFRVQVCTVDMAKPWRAIEEELLDIVASKDVDSHHKESVTQY